MDFINPSQKEKISMKRYGSSLNYFLIALLIVSIYNLTRPIHLVDDGNLYRTYITEDKVTIKFDDRVGGSLIETHPSENPGKDQILIQAYTSPLHRFLARDTVKTLVFDKNQYQSIYYDNHEARLMTYIDGQSNDLSRSVSLPRLVLNYYLILALLALTLIVLIGVFFKFGLKKDEIGKKTLLVGILPGSYILANISIMGLGGSASHYVYRDFAFILLASLAYYGLFWSIYKGGLQGPRKLKLNHLKAPSLPSK